MGGKKNPQEKSKKAENKVKEKIIEDKTFGLKNKNKSTAVQKFIKGVQQQVKGVPKGGEQAKLAAQLQSKEEKKKAQADQALLASLFKTVVDMPKGQDPKLIICSYYKSGLCQKGDKCKFSHDLSSLPVKQEKPDIYHDPRVTASDIICQFFSDAVKTEKFGWFWKCPNGDECIYRHEMPEDYVHEKEEVKELQEDEDAPVFEEEIDKERSALPSGLKPVGLEEFMKWVEADNKAREEEKESVRGKYKGLSGKALFESNAELFQDDLDAVEEYNREEDQENEEEVEDLRLVKEEGFEEVKEEEEAVEEAEEGKTEEGGEVIVEQSAEKVEKIEQGAEKVENIEESAEKVGDKIQEEKEKAESS